MTMVVGSVRSEWLKQKRSLASWMVLTGAFFTPAIIIAARLVNRAGLPALYARDDFWLALWRSSWESVAVFFLPMGAVLATSLFAQPEFKNNTWKQVRALPLSDATIYFSKLFIILTMMGIFFVLFNVGIFLAGVVPSLVVPGVPYPSALIPWQHFLREDALYFIDCLPIVALQFVVSLQFRNFLVLVGGGFMFWVLTLGMLSWKWAFLSPYSYTTFNFLKHETVTRTIRPPVDIHLLAVGFSSAQRKYYNICNNLGMTGTMVREARRGQGLTQQAAARAWGVSQTYLSLMEADKRPVPEPLVRRLARVAPAALTALPKSAVRPDRVEGALGRLGFPGFVHLTARQPLTNPAAVVLRAVTLDEVPARVVEALPWVFVRFVDMDWNWLVDQAKLANCQNRLGYLVHLSRQFAARSAAVDSASHLEAVEHQLSGARLLKTDAFRRDLTDAEQNYLTKNRPEEAAYWNLLTRLQVEDLRYAN